MKARLHTSGYRFHFQGSHRIWNEFFRPLLGGPEAPEDPVVAAATTPAATAVAQAAPTVTVATVAPVATVRQPLPSSPAPAPASWSSPASRPAQRWESGPARPQGQPPFRNESRETRERPAEGVRTWTRRPGGPEPSAVVEPSSDPRTLYDRLATLDSRRGDRDAVLAAVWFIGRGAKDVAPEEVERHLRDHGGPADVKVRPVMLKHVTRTKLLEQGGTAGTVRLTDKGVSQVRMLIGA